MNTLSYAVLSLLARESLSGYDIARRVKERIGFFWQAGLSHIYPELARLEARGLVAHQRVEQDVRPDKKVYSLTGAGLEELRRWVTEPAEFPPYRDELVLKAYSIWVADRARAIALFREHERLHLERLAHYERVLASGGLEADPGGRPPRDSPRFASYIALRRGIGHEREYAAWCRWVVELLEENTGAGGEAPDLSHGDASAR